MINWNTCFMKRIGLRSLDIEVSSQELYHEPFFSWFLHYEHGPQNQTEAQAFSRFHTLLTHVFSNEKGMLLG